MKKIVSLSLTLLMLSILFAGCAGRENSQTTAAADQTTTAQPITASIIQPSLQEVADAMEAVGITDWDGSFKNLSFEQRTALEQYFAKFKGKDVKFSDAGVFYPNLNTPALQVPWAENGILKRVPEPAFGDIFTSSVEEKSVSVSFVNVTAEAIAAYVAQLKAAGLTQNVTEYTSSCCGTVFEADNGSGVKVEMKSKLVAQAITTVTVTVT